MVTLSESQNHLRVVAPLVPSRFVVVVVLLRLGLGWSLRGR